MRRRLPAFTALVLLCLAAGALAHGGGVDSQGGHNDRKQGTYHFHSGPLAGKSFSSKSAAASALAASNTTATAPARASSRNATAEERLEALISLLIDKGLITEAELAQRLR